MYQRKPRARLAEKCVVVAVFVVVKSLTMWHYPAWNSQRTTCLRVLSPTMPNQTWPFLSCGNCQFPSRLALLQVPSQHPMSVRGRKWPATLWGWGACVLSPGKATRGFFCAWQEVLSEPSADEFPFPKSLAAINI